MSSHHLLKNMHTQEQSETPEHSTPPRLPVTQGDFQVCIGSHSIGPQRSHLVLSLGAWLDN